MQAPAMHCSVKVLAHQGGQAPAGLAPPAADASACLSVRQVASAAEECWAVRAAALQLLLACLQPVGGQSQSQGAAGSSASGSTSDPQRQATSPTPHYPRDRCFEGQDRGKAQLLSSNAQATQGPPEAAWVEWLQLATHSQALWSSLAAGVQVTGPAVVCRQHGALGRGARLIDAPPRALKLLSVNRLSWLECRGCPGMCLSYLAAQQHFS